MKMKYIPALLVCISTISNATVKDSTIIYDLPDSVKAVQFMSEITVQAFNEKKYFSAGIKTDAVRLSLTKYVMGKRGIQFVFPAYSLMPAIGLNVGADRRMADMGFAYDWKIGETYKLLISQATDSAGNFSLYSGYVFLPRENKWKLIGSCKIEGRWSTIQKPAYYYYSRGKKEIVVNSGQVCIQRSNGSWKNMKNETLPNPTINLFGHIDSVQQNQIDKKLIEDRIASGKTDVKNNEHGVYYTMMKEGTGRQVSVNDTVVAFYKGYLFKDGLLFDQTKDKPATFSLKRLIKGWQIGVPLCKVGGKIKLVIPSDLAYSIRTRAAKIPPNSILVFEIEVVEVKALQ
jgi:hypothetical protein